ncbi:hypothetical protein M407DRAFT_232745 [Tulasnella calospora MUT 4182]|uniref:Uncharacterized protein n=1 Tax=Tulasnella calospora MUT 4182 TaxID=1051891 RepID=A0A0C3QAV2_9AGAM|nr:hypothetical protein M407DRAFT_232745 [Tulasnella calospora MUT 4182]
MSLQYIGHEGGNSRAVTSTRMQPDSSSRQLTSGGRRLKRSSSDDRLPRYQDRPYEQNDFRFPISLSFKLPWPFGTGDQLAELQSKHQELEDQVKRMREAHWLKEKELRERLGEKERRLNERETELEELKNTLCMYDDCSEADIMKAADNINTKIQDLTCNTAIPWLKAVSGTSNSAGNGGEVGDVEMDDIKGLIGIPLVKALMSAGRQVATTLLPLAWQACMLATVAKIISSFSASLASSGKEQTGDAVLRTIANEVMMGEAQPAYGRWRLITHKYLGQSLASQKQSAVQAYVSEALARCRIVGRLVMKSQCPDDQAFENAFQTQLRAIMEEAFELSTAIQERMITANYEPYMPRSGDSFQSEFMAVEKGDEIFPDDHVVCTTGIGLLYWKKEGRENTSRLSPKLVFKAAQVFTEGNLMELVAST